MGITNEERERHIRIANMLIGVITDLKRPMLMYQIEKDVTKEALENYIKMLEQQPCEDVVSIGVFEQVKWERDVAIEQLEQLGYSLGEKIRTSEDCISREQTLKAFAEKCGGECACCEYNGSGYDNAENCKLIKSMPSVTPKTVTDFADKCQECGKIFNDKLQTKWIPVSERLPNVHEYIKNNGLFNVSDGNRSYFGWFDIYDTKRFVKPTIAGFRVDNAVIAWMPLPEPYNAESEVRNDYYF